MKKEDKERVVAELTERLRSTETLLVADYRGLTMPQIDDLRSKLIEHGARFSVVKNTLTRRAAEAAGSDTLLALLEGPTAIAFLESGGDPVAVAKALVDAARETRVLEVRGGMLEGRPIDPAAVARGRGRIDSLYRAEGYYLASVKVVHVYEAESSRVRVIFDVDEGRRVAIARLKFEGTTHFSDAELVGQMKTGPEGFWWFRSGDYDDDKLRADLQERLPKFYGDRGYVDFQVLGDTLLVDDTTGKATLVVRVSEGDPHRVGSEERRVGKECRSRWSPYH